ncbi:MULTISPECIES: pyridoxal 5'-phosphate synthase glutaminase subunit PdxT [Metabacillus]|uniref:pyridoxal 5'-phosphate synthase glutaminase subunit PdxT n=1 Tax=Metabacillus TaxID=2675233 RepID=UPI000EF62FD1|nr:MULTISPECIES: pyridoxal 5'-phosphate synthase glutaminase subunit PdxT [Metabacillus]MCM3165130.1 pyridoxal 5'-phosphate synthase glutaminase subunit PdxT [Metabacillus litoralis]MCM3413681.1 pyridoxal 5'-phosphate synthase glutaminase subunit PdxT [Metabacillus litoralis]UGB31026.1 pyridoxal 5'-phosphate synthase glutaminase subunit PdxT [Metabacillus sp. B2-18]UHA61071.1 pyridoxal 5'-phosphate synthase glutaminase subunit PdxT [Metabacillus litoralis]
MLKIGVLGLQGAVREHIRSIEACGAEGIVVKTTDQLDDLDGLIIPGGESTTMRRLIDKYNFMEPLKAFAESGKPMFGTCAGLILLAKNLVGYSESHLGLLDVTVERNSFGRQKDSFEAELMITGVGEDFVGVFIRAPHIVEVGEDVEILSKHNGRIVAARQGQFLGCSFHPELTDDHRMTQLFINMVKESK